MARSHNFFEIDHELISTVILLPSAESFKKLQAKVCAGNTRLKQDQIGTSCVTFGQK